MGEKLGILLEKPGDIRTYKTEVSSWELPTQNIGIEVELEQVSQDLGRTEFSPLFVLWQPHEDGSLRNHGMEFTTRVPLFGDDLLQAISLLVPTAIKHNWIGSKRCGIHIHMDMRDAKIEELMFLCGAYAILEKPLFRWIGQGREDNIFCLPWYKAQDNLRYIAILNSKHITSSAAIEATTKIQRYSALNLAALGKFGSIEFRHMETQLDTNRIVTWINLLMCLRRYAAEFNREHDSLSQLLATFSSAGPRVFMESVFRKYTPSLEYRGLEEDLWEGLLVAQDLSSLYKTKFGGAVFKGAELWNGEKNKSYELFFQTHERKEPQVGIGPVNIFTGWQYATHQRMLPADYRWGREWLPEGEHGPEGEYYTIRRRQDGNLEYICERSDR